MAIPKTPNDNNNMCGTVDPKNHVATFAGAHLPVWDSLVIERVDSPRIKSKVAVTGRTERLISGNNNRMVHLTIQHSSPFNAWFTAMHNLDIAGIGTPATGLEIADLEGLIKFSATIAYIEDIPNIEISDSEAVSREWVFYCCGVTENVGG